jgi:FKBP-type peptidyl-prolyl cis-trans isomerase
MIGNRMQNQKALLVVLPLALLLGACASTPTDTVTDSGLASLETPDSAANSLPESRTQTGLPGLMDQPAAPEQAEGKSEVVTLESGLKYQVQKAGDGKTAQPGDTVAVHYTGQLEDGTTFDSSVGKQPFAFTLGQNRVIPGWEQGVVGMKEGEVRVLAIPAALGYGARGNPPAIPANANLLFQVELLQVQ